MKRLIAIVLSAILSVPVFGAQSAVYFPGQADGVNVDARAVNDGAGNKRMVFVVGDSTSTANVAPVSATLGLMVQISSTSAGTTIAQEPRSTSQNVYSASAVNIAVSTGAWCALYGAAGKTIKIVSIKTSGIAATALSSNLSINKRSTVPTGVVASSPTVVPHNSGSAAGSGVMKSFTVNPTAGSLVGLVDSYNVIVGTTVAEQFYSRDFDQRPLVLTTAAEGVSLDSDGTVYSTPKINCSFTWTEE